jgi:hypothetical protein
LFSASGEEMAGKDGADHTSGFLSETPTPPGRAGDMMEAIGTSVLKEGKPEQHL